MTYEEMLQQATEAVVQVHHSEMQAFLAGEIAANQWRPEKYAEAVLAIAGIRPPVREPAQ